MPKLNFSNYFLTEADNTTHVATYMRANPPTIGHERVVNKVQELAKDLDANHSVILSHSHDGDKNPLTIEQKLRHAKIAFPGANITSSSPESPSLMHQLSNLYARGVRNLHLVFGADRLKPGGFADTIRKYNGVEAPPEEGGHGYYKFNNLQFHSAGERDPDAEGVEGISGTDQRKKALGGDFQGYRAGAPSRYNDQQVLDQMNDVKNGIVPKAPKKITAAKAVTKLKKLKENTTTADVRGFGYVTGDPAVDGVVNTNDVDSLFFRGGLKNSIKQSENPLAGIIGFKTFDPDKMNTRDKSLQYYEKDENHNPLLRDKNRNRGKNNNVTKG